MAEVLADLSAFPPRNQPETGVTYARKVEKSELRLDFGQPAEQVERQIRAFNPPGAYFEANGERVRVLEAIYDPGESRGPVSNRSQLDPSLRRGGTVLNDRLEIECGQGLIRPTLVQRAGRDVMTSSEFLRGFSVPPGTQL
jgi:methionyl-tRNA formyltransferase